MKKLTKKQFIELTEKGPLEINKDINYVAIKMNSENVKMSKKFKNQLIKENKYDNTYLGFLTSSTNGPYMMENLPIYGRSDKYETKHFAKNLEDAVMADLSGLKLLGRHLKHQLNMQEGK